MGTILFAFSTLKSCMHPSGASEDDIVSTLIQEVFFVRFQLISMRRVYIYIYMYLTNSYVPNTHTHTDGKSKAINFTRAKIKNCFKFDHAWMLLKDTPKFTDNVNIGISDISNIGNDTVDSPLSGSVFIFN